VSTTPSPVHRMSEPGLVRLAPELVQALGAPSYPTRPAQLDNPPDPPRAGLVPPVPRRPGGGTRPTRPHLLTRLARGLQRALAAGGDRTIPPTGTVALLFTDIEGSTRLARELGPTWNDVLARHHELVRSAIIEHGGWVDSAGGDGFFATFDNATAAAQAAVAAQRALRVEPWPGGLGQVRVRMGMHVGWLERTCTGYVGLEIHRAARVAAAARGGQLLVTAAARHLLGEWLPLTDLGAHPLKDFPAPEQLFCAVIDRLGPWDSFPPRCVAPPPGTVPPDRPPAPRPRVRCTRRTDSPGPRAVPRLA